MQAVTIEQEGATPALRSDPWPTLAAGEVVVRVRASSVDPMDAAIAAGMVKGMVEHVFPITLGRDFAARGGRRRRRELRRHRRRGVRDVADAPAALADLGAEHTQDKLAIRVA
jgi:hypothetical protein